MVKEVKHSEGREFYDDGYSSDEEEIQNRIDFSRVSFQGREEELNALKGTYNKLTSKDPATTSKDASFPIPMTLVTGSSGTGKSSLVTQFYGGIIKDQLTSGSNKKVVPRCLAGKYNEFTFAKPFSAIADAMSGWISTVVHGDDEDLSTFQKDVRKKVGAEISILFSVVPELADACGTGKCASNNAMTSQENAWNRVKYAFQSFFNAICTRHNPVVMFLDDLQWADVASLELIESLLADKSLRYFMFIGGIRDEELNDEHPVTDLMKSVAAVRKVEKIMLENLSQETTVNVLAQALELEVEEVKELGVKIHDKTGGNIFFTKQAIDELDRKNIVYFCHISFQWKWNLDQVDEGLTDNVVATVLAKIRTAPELLQKALSTAAYTRSSFDVETLLVLMESVGYQIELEELIKTLDSAVLAGLLSNRVGSRIFKFSHDRIQQAAYMLVPEGGERSALSMALGRKLYELGRESNESWMLFVAADHLNANSLQHIDPLFMADLNLEVGERSMNVAAFAQASIYLKKGIAAVELLNFPWTDHYTLILKLYRALAHAELCQGNYDYGHECAEKVLKNATSLTEKLPTYISMTHALGRQDRQDEAFNCCRNVAIEMGIYPKKFLPYHVLKLLSWAKGYFKNHTDDDILSLPASTNETTLHLQNILQQIVFRGKMVDEKLDFLTGTLVAMKIGLKEGLSGVTIQAIAGYSAFLMFTGDNNGSLRMSRLTRRLCSQYDGIESECWISLMLGLYVVSWTMPHSEVLPLLRRGYIVGMEVGEIECAFMNEYALTQAAFLAGYPLSALEGSATKSVEQIELYGVKSALVLQNKYKILFQCLTGSIKYMDALQNSIHLAPEGGNVNFYIAGLIAMLIVAVFFGELDLSEKIVQKIEADDHQSGNSYASSLTLWLYKFLAFAGLAKKTKMRKYYKQANALLKEMKKSGKPLQACTVHRLQMMEAEMKMLKGRNALKVRKAYDEAIMSAVESGCIQDVALCCELAGETYLDMNNHELARYYFSQAHSYYQSWGALAKARQLEQTRTTYIEEDAPMPVGSIPVVQQSVMRSVGLRMSSKLMDQHGSRATLGESTTEARDERSFWNGSHSGALMTIEREEVQNSL